MSLDYPARRLDQIMSMDSEEMVRGYREGLKGFQAESLRPAYQHGWNNGIADRTGEPDSDQHELAREYLKRLK